MRGCEPLGRDAQRNNFGSTSAAIAPPVEPYQLAFKIMNKPAVPKKPRKDAPKRPPRGFGLTESRVLTRLGSVPARSRKAAIAAARNTVSDGTASLLDQLDHVAACLMLDTIGLELHNAWVKLPKTVAAVDEDMEADEGSARGYGRTQRDSGKKSFHVTCRKLPKKQRIAEAAALVKGGSTLPKAGTPEARALESMIYIEGSPAMHYQGHNIVASNDVTMMAHDMVKAVYEEHRFDIPNGRRLAIARGRDALVTRLDVVVLVKLPEGVDKEAVINAVAMALVMNGSNMRLFAGQSVYCDYSSQMRAFKLYDKKAELAYRKGFQAPDTEAGRVLVEICDNTLRLEFVFRRKYFATHTMFRGHPVYPQRFDPELLALMVIEELARTRMFGKLARRYGQDELLGVPIPYRTTLALWQNGGDVRAVLGEEEAAVHRRYLRGRFKGLDIFKPAPAVLPAALTFAEVLHPRNFVVVPHVVKEDAKLFHTTDMKAEVARRLSRVAGWKNLPIPSPVQAKAMLLMRRRKPFKPGKPRRAMRRTEGVGTRRIDPYIEWDAERAERALLGEDVAPSDGGAAEGG